MSTKFKEPAACESMYAVSYTHLDVYKRQAHNISLMENVIFNTIRLLNIMFVSNEICAV